MKRVLLALALLASSCERPRGQEPESAPPSPNASILPAPLATGVAEAPGSAREPAPPPEDRRPDAATLPSAETLRGDQALPADALTAKETSGLVLSGEWRWIDAPAPTRAPEVHAEGLVAARKATAFRWTLAVTESGRMRARFEGRGFPVPQGTELRARADRYGHVLVFPGGTEYRPAPPGALRALFGDRRLDVLPLVAGQVTARGAAPVRAPSAVRARRVEVTSKTGTLVLDLAHVPESGLGAALLCRTMVELVAVDPISTVCAPEELPVRAQLTWPSGGGISFELGELPKKADVPLADVLTPPPAASLAPRTVPEQQPVLLGREELAAFRTRTIDLPAPPRGAPTEGLVAHNATDGLRYLTVDGVPVAWVLPGADVMLPGFLRGRYLVGFRGFLGDAAEPPRTVELPARVGVGEPADAGAPAPPKSSK